MCGLEQQLRNIILLYDLITFNFVWYTYIHRLYSMPSTSQMYRKHITRIARRQNEDHRRRQHRRHTAYAIQQRAVLSTRTCRYERQKNRVSSPNVGVVWCVPVFVPTMNTAYSLEAARCICWLHEYIYNEVNTHVHACIHIIDRWCYSIEYNIRHYT